MLVTAVVWTMGELLRNTDRDFVLHIDNVPVHVSVPALAFNGEDNIDLLAHPACSPNLVLCDFWAFPALKKQLHRHKFPNVEALQADI